MSQSLAKLVAEYRAFQLPVLQVKVRLELAEYFTRDVNLAVGLHRETGFLHRICSPTWWTKDLVYCPLLGKYGDSVAAETPDYGSIAAFLQGVWERIILLLTEEERDSLIPLLFQTMTRIYRRLIAVNASFYESLCRPIVEEFSAHPWRKAKSNQVYGLLWWVENHEDVDPKLMVTSLNREHILQGSPSYLLLLTSQDCCRAIRTRLYRYLCDTPAEEVRDTLGEMGATVYRHIPHDCDLPPVLAVWWDRTPCLWKMEQILKNPAYLSHLQNYQVWEMTCLLLGGYERGGEWISTGMMIPRKAVEHFETIAEELDGHFSAEQLSLLRSVPAVRTYALEKAKLCWWGGESPSQEELFRFLCGYEVVGYPTHYTPIVPNAEEVEMWHILMQEADSAVREKAVLDLFLLGYYPNTGEMTVGYEEYLPQLGQDGMETHRKIWEQWLVGTDNFHSRSTFKKSETSNSVVMHMMKEYASEYGLLEVDFIELHQTWLFREDNLRHIWGRCCYASVDRVCYFRCHYRSLPSPWRRVEGEEGLWICRTDAWPELDLCAPPTHSKMMRGQY